MLVLADVKVLYDRKRILVRLLSAKEQTVTHLGLAAADVITVAVQIGPGRFLSGGVRGGMLID